MIHRQNNVLLTDSEGNPGFASGYSVLVGTAGAVASAASAGTTATVDEGHSFIAGDRALQWDGTTATFIGEAVDSVTVTTIVWSAATPTISSGDKLFNLGPDTGSGGAPNYNASRYTIYTDADGTNAITSSTVTTGTSGNYSYYSDGFEPSWELIRDASGVVAMLISGWGGQTAVFADGATLGDAPNRMQFKRLTTFPNELYVSMETTAGVWEWVSVTG